MLALPLLALLLAAPPPEQGRAEALLASSRPIDKAWGAHLAGRLNLTPLIPSLISELDRLRPIPTTSELENWSLAHALLDSLIELKAPLSYEQLKPWIDLDRPEALILLLQNADANLRELLELRPTLINRPHWLAVNNVLIARRAPGIGAALWSEAEIKHRLFVYVGGGVGEGFSGGFGLDHAKRELASAAGFPPIHRQELVDDPRPGDALFAAGPDNVFIRRTLIPTDTRISSERFGALHRPNSDLPPYLAFLAGIGRDGCREPLNRSSSIAWTNSENLLGEVKLRLSSQAATLRRLVLATARNGYLSDSELSNLKLRIEVKFRDDRQLGLPPLPTVPPYPIDLTSR